MCDIHGLVEHSKYAGKKGTYVVWKCTPCRLKDNLDRYHATKDRPKSPPKVVVPIETCPSCFIALPKTRVCEECE